MQNLLLNAKTRRSKDGTWTKKNSVSHFGNKLHTVQGTDIPLIRDFVVTTASLHDSQVDLSIPGIPCYKDKGYSGGYCKDINATMDKGIKESSTHILEDSCKKRDAFGVSVYQWGIIIEILGNVVIELSYSSKTPCFLPVIS